MATRHGRECRWQSMLLGVSVLKVMGMRPLTEIPLKGDYLSVDLARYLRRHKLTLARTRKIAPSNPIPAGRTFHWIDQHDRSLAKTVAKAILDAYWRKGEDIGSADAVIAIARHAVDRSLARGVFGSPFFIVNGEPFFGLEKMELVDEWLASGGW